MEIKDSLVPVIESLYPSFTETEKVIAQYFIQPPTESSDYSAKSIAQTLHVSEASLTRFAQKCGYQGYREFIFAYRQKDQPNYQNNALAIENVLKDYSEIINKTYSLMKEEQLTHIAQLISETQRIYIYGIGSSGYAAQETRYRLMRLGLTVDAITDPEMMAMNQVVLNSTCLVIGFSISGETFSVLKSLKQAASQGAKTLLITSKAKPLYDDQIQVILNCASLANLNFGNRISPQLPILMVIDIIYDYIMDLDRVQRGKVFLDTLFAIEKGVDNKDE